MLGGAGAAPGREAAHRLTSTLAVETQALRRVYRGAGGAVIALDGVDLAVRQGELFGVLGPNGAGKTTLIKILVTLLLPSDGWARVDGLDVVHEHRALRRRISLVSGGENSGYGPLTVREQVWMFSQLHGMPSRLAYRRIDELFDRLGLREVADRRVHALSSGMRQKMNLVRGLVTDPRVLFLDEPTVALDVGAARDLRDEVRRWMGADAQRTVILTTHHMAEADELCDRIAIVDRGRIIALGTPAELKRQVQDDVVVDLCVQRGAPLLDALRALDGVTAAGVEVEDGVDRISLHLVDEAALGGVLTAVERGGRRLVSLGKREPTLEDAFVRLTGHSLREDASA